MRNIRKMLKEDDLGDMGIGAMIVFIAMVLVAGIAASVLIQTANRLEIQAMTTGQETTREVSTGLAVIDIEGQNDGSGVITQMTITVRARAGSGDIDLSQTIIELTDGTVKTLLTYDPTALQFNVSTDESGDIFLTGFWNMSNEQFGILVLQDEDSSLTASNPVINRGDLVMLCINTDACFTADGGLAPRADVWGLVSPEQGASGIFAFRVPSSLTEQVYDLY